MQHRALLGKQQAEGQHEYLEAMDHEKRYWKSTDMEDNY
ncbi:hypothetical protein CCP3SC15_2600003 [Gammaproteobacteria bacterium]